MLHWWEACYIEKKSCASHCCLPKWERILQTGMGFNASSCTRTRVVLRAVHMVWVKGHRIWVLKYSSMKAEAHWGGRYSQRWYKRTIMSALALEVGNGNFARALWQKWVIDHTPKWETNEFSSSDTWLSIPKHYLTLKSVQVRMSTTNVAPQFPLSIIKH